MIPLSYPQALKSPTSTNCDTGGETAFTSFTCT